MSTNNELQKHLKRWQSWNRQLQLQSLKLTSHSQFTTYADTIIHKLNKPISQQLQTSLKHQIQNINSCGICLDIMLSPKQPYSIYPCGHSFCKKCLFGERQKDTKNVKNVSLKTCPYCRQKIQGCALNLSLLKMIRKSEEQEKVEGMDKEGIEIRYRIIKGELQEMKGKLRELKGQLQIKERVDKKLMEDKMTLKKEMEKLIQQDNLIDTHRAGLTHEIKILRQLVETTTEKYLLLQKTHEEIRIDKDKNSLF